MRRGLSAAVWGSAAAAVVFALGAWGGSVAAGERGAFTMNFPASGTEVGGPSPRELTGHIVVNVDEQGFVKRLVQPNVIEVASHVVRNVGDKPLKIRFAKEGFEGAEAEWHSRDKAFDPETGVIERLIVPGEAVDFGLLLTFPKPLPAGQVVSMGTIVVSDAQTGVKLSALPVTIAHDAAAVAGGSCCE